MTSGAAVLRFRRRRRRRDTTPPQFIIIVWLVKHEKSIVSPNFSSKPFVSDTDICSMSDYLPKPRDRAAWTFTAKAMRVAYRSSLAVVRRPVGFDWRSYEPRTSVVKMVY